MLVGKDILIPRSCKNKVLLSLRDDKKHLTILNSLVTERKGEESVTTIFAVF
jgi:hypothetical protein